LDLGVENSTAYDAAGATIFRVPATSVSREIDLLNAWAIMEDLQAAAGIVLAKARKYTSSGVRYSRH
jgi:hypothetical protein